MSISNLNPPQAELVQHKVGPCIGIAGPGAGKTAVLTQRAAALVRGGVPPERILLLTFTRTAALEMMNKAKAIEPACAHISGGTFHSVATKVINRNAHIFGLDKPFTIIDPSDCKEIVKRIIAVKKTGEENWPQASSVYKVISYCANTRMSVEEACEAIYPQHIDFADLISEIRDEYVSYKLERGLLDYDDCLEYFVALLEDEQIGPIVRSEWDYVMVDEYQDTNAVQLDIIYNLANNSENILIVGDPGQAIYGFRGSAPSTMSKFRDRFPNSRVIQLETNYRSSPEIVRLVNAVDKKLDSGFQRELISGRVSDKTPPSMIHVTNSADEARVIADSIIEHKDQSGELGDIAVLVRSMSYARRIEVEFTSRKIPYRVVGGLRIDEAAHVKDLLSIARVATNSAHEPGWLRLLQRHRKIGAVAATEIAARLVSLENPSEAADILREEANARKTDFDALPEALEYLTNRTLSPEDALTNAIALMEDFWSNVKEWKDDWQDRRKDLDAILTIASEHFDLEGFLTAVTLDYSVDQKKEIDSIKDDEKPVTISTIHGAKGLEWPIVHIPSFVKGHLPSIYANDMQEECRILYVAISRAMNDLRMYRPQFTEKGDYSITSDFESMLVPHMNVRRNVVKNAPGTSINTANRIDMKARLLGKR